MYRGRRSGACSKKGKSEGAAGGYGQVHLPDPTLDDIHYLQHENEQLRSELQKMGYELKDMQEREAKCRRARELAEQKMKKE